MIEEQVLEQNSQNRKKVWLYIGGAVFFYAIIVFIMSQLVNAETVKGEVQSVVQSYGVLGLFFTVMLLDSFTQPVSPDVAVFSAVHFAQLDFVMVMIIAGIASAMAGLICYTIGQKFGIAFLQKRFQQKTIDKGERVMSKYGNIGVLVGAMTPVPYDMVCYLSGIFKVKLPSFAILSFVGRLLRFGVSGLIAYSIL